MGFEDGFEGGSCLWGGRSGRWARSASCPSAAGTAQSPLVTGHGTADGGRSGRGEPLLVGSNGSERGVRNRTVVATDRVPAIFLVDRPWQLLSWLDSGTNIRSSNEINHGGSQATEFPVPSHDDIPGDEHRPEPAV